MSYYARDLKRIFEAHVLKCLAAVAGPVDAITPCHAVAVVGLAGTDPKNLWICLEHGDSADGGRAVVVKDRCPSGSSVDRLPDAPGRRGDDGIAEIGIQGLD